MPPARLDTPHERDDVPLPGSGNVPVADDAFNHELSVASRRLKPPNVMRSMRLFGAYAWLNANESLVSVSVLESVLLLLLLRDLISVLYSISSLNVQVRRCMTAASKGAAWSSFRFPLLRAKLLQQNACTHQGENVRRERTEQMHGNKAYSIVTVMHCSRSLGNRLM